MKWQTIGTAILLSLVMATAGLSQCSRSGGRSTGNVPSAQNFGSQITQSLANPYGSFFTGLQSPQVQMQQLAMRQALAQQQSRFAQQTRQRTRQRSSSDNRTSSVASNRPTAREVRLRRENAERAFALAVKAELRDKSQLAEKYYRRAIKIAGSDSELTERAESAIAALSPSNEPNSNTALASLQLVERN